MTLLAVVLTLAFGAFVGTLSGLLGIGGGVLNVPFLYGLFGAGPWTGIRIPVESQTVMAHATSLAVVLPTALSAAWVHHRARRVDWSVAMPMALGALLGAPLGARAAVGVDPAVLRLMFGVLLLTLGSRLALRGWQMRRAGGEDRLASGEVSPGPQGGLRIGLAALVGALGGSFAALLGFGGAAVTIPILIWVLRVDLARVAGTAIVGVIAAASAGVVSYATAPQVPGLESLSLGLVFVPVVLVLAPGAVLMAQLGARLNHRLDTERLLVLFSLLLSLIGLRLVTEFLLSGGLG